MSKLTTTVDNIELKTNKVTASVPSSTWTDSQYPSAKTLYNTYNKLLNMLHPIGSIFITDTNTNPSDVLGGTWELVDKTFTPAAFSVDASCWINNTNTELATYGIWATRIGHTVSIRVHLKFSDTVYDNTSNVVLGKLDLSAFGISRFEYAVMGNTTISDSGNCTIGYNFDSDGTVLATDILNVNGTHTVSAGNDFFVNIVQPVKHGYMLDSYCNQFYWKRTA
jgi:hypothetical protein